MPNQKNIQGVTSLIEKLKNSPNFILVGFENTPHKKMEELRRILNEQKITGEEAFFEVVKNTLFEVAVKKMRKEDLVNKKALFGPSAVLSLPQDWTTRLSAFYQFAKADKSLRLKIGLIDDKVYLQSDLETLAQLPTKEQLLAKLLGVMKSPQRKFIFTMQFGMMRLVNVLKAKK